MNPITHTLLVVTEGVPRDADVLAAAARLLRPDSHVVLMRVLPPPATNEAPATGDLLPPVDRAERHALDELRSQARAFPGNRVTPVVLVGSDPDAEIARWIASHPVDAVVIPARERRGLGLLWPGRRAPRLAQLGHTPVITVYPAPAPATRQPTFRAA